MKGMKNMAIVTNISTFANARISAYHELAKKATETGGAGVDSQDSGVVAALKRFFYKLDFLLKYGQFPSVEDTAQDALPPELQRLRDFLKVPQGEGMSYILQKDANTRYCFTWSEGDKGKVTVTEEIRTSTFLADVRANPDANVTNPDANVTWYQGDMYLYQPNDLLVGLGLEQPVAEQPVAEQPVQIVAELFRSKLDNFFKANRVRNELMSGKPNDFVIKTEITNDGELGLRFSFNISGKLSRDITCPFKNEREMINVLSRAYCHSPLTDIVSDGEKRCSLLGHILEKAVQAGISLQGIHLKGANLNGAYLNGAHMENANLSEAYLNGAYLNGAHMENANLSGAYLRGTYLNGAHMENANLTWTNMEGAHVKGVSLEGARVSLEGARVSLEDTYVNFEGLI